MTPQDEWVLRPLVGVACWIAIAMSASSTAAQEIDQQQPANDPASETVESDAAEPDVADHVAVDEVTSDEAIQSRLTSILDTTGWFEGVRIEVRDSVAFLEGTTPEEERKEWAAQLVRNTEGIAAVVNRIEVARAIDLSQTVKVVSTSVKSLWDDFLTRSPLIVAGLLALLLTAVVAKLVRFVISRVAIRSGLGTSLQDLVLQLTTIGLWIAGLMVAAVVVFPGMTPAKVLTVLGLSSVAVGFAFKDIFENFFAGILILWKYPFDKGDFIACGDIEGRIEEITIRMSMIRQVDGQLVVVPNAMLFKNPVDVLTNQPSRRTTVMCGVAYDADLNEARQVIHEAVENCASVRNHQHPIEIFAREFADSSINFEVTWWTGATPKDIRESRDEVVRAVKRALNDADIEIPFPQRTLWLPKPIETFDGRQTAEFAAAAQRQVGSRESRETDR